MSRSGLGTVAWWGFSQPKIFISSDFIETSSDLSAKTKKILLVGSSDPRHIISTSAEAISRKIRGNNNKLTFYIFEPCLQTYARQLLLLTLAFHPAINDKHSRLETKVEEFLEILGNITLQAKTKQRLDEVLTELMRSVLETRRIQIGAATLDLSLLKRKEIDSIESIFQTWRSTNDDEQTARAFWDDRLRANLGDRYDNREAVFDWDYSMKFTDRGLETCAIREEYICWRNSGKVYQSSLEKDESTEKQEDFPVINPTLIASKDVGFEKSIRGYWGDIISSPFPAWAPKEPEFPQLLSVENNRRKYSGQDAIFWDLFSKFHIIRNGKKTELNTNFDFKTRRVPGGGSDQNPKNTPEDTEIVFLPNTSLANGILKANTKFNAIFLSAAMVHQLGSDCLAKSLVDGGSLEVEPVDAILEMNRPQCEQYNAQVEQMGNAQGLTICHRGNHEFVPMTFRKNIAEYNK